MKYSFFWKLSEKIPVTCEWAIIHLQNDLFRQNFCQILFLLLRDRDYKWSYLHLLCILTSFQVLHTSKAWSKNFFGLLLNLFDDFRRFSVMNHLKTKKVKKTVFKPLFILCDTHMLVPSLRGYLNFAFLGVIFSLFCLILSIFGEF